MKRIQNCLAIGALIAVVATLAACGGGGGGGGGGGTGGTGSTTLTAPTLTLTPQSVKTFHFTWTGGSGATEYRLLENPDGSSGYTQVGAPAVTATSYDLAASLPGRINASYILRACNSDACTDSAPVAVSGTLAAAVGYVKASNTRAQSFFGYSIALSADGGTMAVGAIGESSGATGIGGDQSDTSAVGSGAVYVFTRSGLAWSQQAYVKASNTGVSDNFGSSIALSADGGTMAVGAVGESSSATGIDGNQADNSAVGSGAVYVFTRSGAAWSQQAYVKASNTGAGDGFGIGVALSGDGGTLAVGAAYEGSSATGIDGNQADNSASQSGAVYVFTRSGAAWSQQAYVKASNTEAGDWFGTSVALSGDGATLAVGAVGESSSATGSDGNQADNSAVGSGAVYVFTRSGAAWSQQAYVKASNTGADDRFGYSAALSGDGATLAVGAAYEDSSATGIGGNQADNSAGQSGAAYVFTRSGAAWSQQAYVKASNTGTGDLFGYSIALSSDGATLAVGAIGESSSATGIGGTQTDNSNYINSGAAYVFTRNGTAWSQQAYVKASNTGKDDWFGGSIALSGDGGTLAAGAIHEHGGATGIGGNQADISASNGGAAYLY
ncbi:FG-GAP repeat protein [Geobacter sp. AOG2]|uniref:FG-GAP repeat protein n=1 Tax=Geobacter sp. AOG2 TaxID=1566347 RepID=UPI001CC5AB3D|nr:FG-GAP repeat protein [Geobacter sp. AOG2]GFE59572.1 hypothetical protein AOG2_01600 [Geobacter sp. AOG2]